jgi:hypothetical protein
LAQLFHAKYEEREAAVSGPSELPSFAAEAGVVLIDL